MSPSRTTNASFLARARRRTASALSAVALVLCLAMIVVWIASYGPRRTLLYSAYGSGLMLRYARIDSSRGSILIDVDVSWDNYPLWRPSQSWSARGWEYLIDFPLFADEPVNPICGFAFIPGPHLTGGSRWQLLFPDWAAVLVLGACGSLVVVRARNSLRHQRPDHSVCAACGYDLRATPERCPECGTVVAAKA